MALASTRSFGGSFIHTLVNTVRVQGEEEVLNKRLSNIHTIITINYLSRSKTYIVIIGMNIAQRTLAKDDREVGKGTRTGKDTRPLMLFLAWRYNFHRRDRGLR